MALTQLHIATSVAMSGLCINEKIMKRLIDISISCEISSCCQSIFYINVFFFTGNSSKNICMLYILDMIHSSTLIAIRFAKLRITVQ